MIAKMFDGNRVRLQTTPKQKEKLILRFYTEGGAPGVTSMKAAALFKDLAKRFISS
jgi:cellulose synthase (UDP-forming)|tara:strand:- start:640 stop:807 length:168 start_codon:yes stop_codon:yes gene_type:complete